MNTIRPKNILVLPLVLPLSLAIFTFALLVGVLGSQPQVALAQPSRDEVSGTYTTPVTWTLANSPYTMTGDVIVDTDVTLTIEPGVVVKGRESTELRVLGHLEAVGTEGNPILFTSEMDGGPRQWSGLVFDGGTGNLHHATVRYAGQGNSIARGNIAVRNGALHVESSRVISENNSYVDHGLYIEGSQVVVSDTLFSGNGNISNDHAIYATGASTVLTVTGSTFRKNSGDALSANSGIGTVTDSTFEGNAGFGLYAASAAVTFTHNSFHNNGWSVGVDPDNLDGITYHDNTISGNTHNRLGIGGGSVFSDTRLPVIDLAGHEGYVLAGDVSVPATVTLTVDPGVTVMGENNVELQVLGHLEAVGTEGDPILFTSATDTGPSQWSGLVLDGGTGDLHYATVRYAGNWNGISYGNIAVRNGALHIESSQVISEYNSSAADYGLYVQGSQVVVSDTLFSGNGKSNNDYALYATGASTVLTVTASTFENNDGHVLYASGVISVTDSTFQDNSRDGIYVDSGIGTVTHSTFEGNGGFGLYAASAAVTFTHNTFHANGWAVGVDPDNLDGITYHDNTISGNTHDRLGIGGGSVLSGTHLSLISLGGREGYVLADDVSVPLTVTLTVDPGVTVMGENNVELQVLGHLEAVGTEGDPILFTSATDTGPGQWSGLAFDGGTGDLRHVTVRYAGDQNGITYSSIGVRNGQLRIESSQVISESADYYSTPDYGLYASNSQVVVSDTLFSGNGKRKEDYGLYATGASTVLTVTGSTFDNNGGHGMQIADGQAIVSDTSFTSNGNNASVAALGVTGVGSVLVRHATVADNAGDGVTIASGSSPSVTVTHSAIHGNGAEGVDNDSGVSVDARNNWWGDRTGPGGEGIGTGDEVSGDVVYYPWLPVPDLMLDVTANSHDVDGDVVAWRDIGWPSTGAVTVTVRVGNTPTPDEHWYYWTTFTDSPADLSGLPPSRYLEWFIYSTTVPSAGDVVVTHDPFTYTTVSGLINDDTTWRLTDSPYLVAGNNILVNQGSTLIVEPGVTVWFSETRAMQVDGTLVALGTASQPITFTSWHPQGQKEDWGGIAFGQYAEDASFDGSGNYLDGSVLQYTTVEYAGAGGFYYAVDAPDTAVYVDHCTIRHNGSGGLRVGGDENYVTHNTVSQNDGAGIHNAGSPVLITGNIASGNTGSGIYNTGALGIILDNTTSDNVTSDSGGGIYNSGGGAVSDNTVINNQASSHGGGIYNSGGGTVSDNIVADNQASRGGGIYNDGSGTVSGNTVTDNQASSRGGGISHTGGGGTVSHNTVTTNTAHAPDPAYGAGIYSSGACTISHNLIAGNVAYYTNSPSSDKPIGGGIYSVSGGVVESNEVRANSASGDRACAGGVYISDGSLHGNTIVSNTAQGNVGGVYWVSSGGEMLHNTVVSNTTSGNTGGLYVLSGYPTINHNGFAANSGLALYNNNVNDGDSDTRLDARYNWWGTTDESTVRSLIWDWFDNFDLDFVDYVPYLFDQPTLSPAGINLSGSAAGLVGVSYIFDASVYPIAAVQPITYVWQATDQPPDTRTLDALFDTTRFTWLLTGTKHITLTASNREGTAVATYTLDIATSSSSDAYEVDDLCTQAYAIPTNGATQLHTFHSSEDVDWAFFQATAGTTYIIEATTSADSEADVSLEIYGTCDGNPEEGQDNSFSPDISLTFDAPFDGPLYLRLENSGDVVGEEGAAYYLSVRGLGEAPDPGVVVLVAGKRKLSDPLQSNIRNVTNSVYRLFLANGYTGDRIYYLAYDDNPNNLDLDADGDGTSDVDELATRSNLEQAITEWAAAEADADHPFTLYMMDHGDYDLFYLNLLAGGPETVTPPELAAWLDELEAAAPGVKVNVILEACKSGSFIDLAQMISGPGRVVVASTGAYPVAYASQNGAIFSDAFVAALGRGMSLNSSFAEAKWTLQQAHPDQTPWLDDNGNGIPNEVEDGQEAAQRGFAYAGTFSDPQWPPYIAQAVAQITEGVIKAQVQPQGGRAVSSTWALIYRPSYEPPPPGQDMVRDEDNPNVDKRVLQDPEEDGIYTVSYGFVEPGTYRVVIYAVDDRGLSARPRETDYEGVNHAPITPFNPVPADRASNVPITQLLSWLGGDIDGDPVTYTVAFGTLSPPPVVAPVVTATTYDPGPLVLDTTYYWGITATDGLTVSVGGIWQFTTASGDLRVYLPLVIRNG
jgi:hypothetical protein